jgi:hypothetical protein
MRDMPAQPLVRTAASAVGSYLGAIALQLAAAGTSRISIPSAVVWVVAGALYTNLFEHAWHRFAMHSRWPDRRHGTHHRVFYGSAFQSSDPRALQDIVTAWYIFPLLLAIHYPVYVSLFGAVPAPIFFLGVVLHFVTYEVTHWYTHIADNRFDHFISRIPGVRRVRAMQIRHHRLHHADPRINFNFNPPYAGDWVGRVLRP